jgi:MFS transporter, PAT family, beta-lactamase induction signal transducer AmpG
VAVIWVTTLVVLISSDREEYRASGPLAATVRSRLSEFLETLRLVLRRPETWLGLALALIAFAGFKAVGDIAGPFLVDQGFTQSQVGHFFTGALVAMIVGALAGGWAADRFGNTRAISIFVVVAVAVILATSVAAWVAAAGHATILVGLLGVYVCAGLLTASGYALFMQLTDPKLGATQFSAYMGAINACEAWAGFTAGQLAERFDYPVAFVTVALISLLALPLLGRIRAVGARDGREVLQRAD